MIVFSWAAAPLNTTVELGTSVVATALHATVSMQPTSPNEIA